MSHPWTELDLRCSNLLCVLFRLARGALEERVPRATFLARDTQVINQMSSPLLILHIDSLLLLFILVDRLMQFLEMTNRPFDVLLLPL